MSVQIIDFYRKTCFVGEGDLTTEKWSDGTTPTLTITPAVSKVIRITSLQFLMKDGFEIDDAFRINPWGNASPANVDIDSFLELVSVCTNRIPVPIGAENYHKLILDFKPFIEVSHAGGTVFTVSNSGGEHAVLTPGIDVRIAVFSQSISQADA